jgi:hypothetical protein
LRDPVQRESLAALPPPLRFVGVDLSPEMIHQPEPRG